MNNGITTRGDETLDASKTVRCDFCGEHSAHERFDELKFPYGPEGVILSAIVAVTECTVCEEAYAGEDAEIQRELAVRKHLHAIAERPLGDAIEEQDDITCGSWRSEKTSRRGPSRSTMILSPWANLAGDHLPRPQLSCRQSPTATLRGRRLLLVMPSSWGQRNDGLVLRSRSGTKRACR
jgi:hypothetical protein